MTAAQDTRSPEDGLTVHSFIVKIWREERETGGTQKWRGIITHVPSKQQQHLESLGEVLDFIRPYLQAMGVRTDLGWSLKQWLARRKRSRRSQ